MRGRLIHPFAAELAQLDPAATAADPDGPGPLTSGSDADFQETVLLPAAGARGRDARREKPPIRVPCQVEVQAFGELTELATGNSPRSTSCSCSTSRTSSSWASWTRPPAMRSSAPATASSRSATSAPASSSRPSAKREADARYRRAQHQTVELSATVLGDPRLLAKTVVEIRTEFGSLLHRLRHQKTDSLLQELGRVYVVEALKRWEPRIAVTAVTIGREQHDGENVLAIRLRYDVISGDSPETHVVLGGIEQTVLISR